MMKKLTYWLLGERAGHAVVALWNWLWGLPLDSGGKVAVEVAQESLQDMQRSVYRLTESVAQITASYRTAREKYESKQREFQETEQRAIFAHKNGNTEAARLAMSKAIAIEQLLPQLAQQVEQAENILQTQKQRLDRERQRLETYKVELQNLKDLAEVNQALKAIARINSEIGSDSATWQFDNAKTAVQKRYQQQNALAELAENPAERLTADLDKMMIDDEVTRRLQRLSDEDV